MAVTKSELEDLDMVVILGTLQPSSSKMSQLLFPLPLPISSTDLHPLVGCKGKGGKPRGKAGSW